MAPSPSRKDGRRRLSLAALLSLAFHLTAMLVLGWLIVSHVLTIPKMQPPERVTLSSTTRIEPQTHPAPPNVHPPTVTSEKVAPVPTHAAAPRHELARDQPKASPQPPQPPHKPSVADELAAQEARFAQTAQRLHAENNPLSVATPNGTPGGPRKQYVNEMGQERQTSYYAMLTPTQHWFDGDRSCYYASYHMQTDTGGSEDGSIPWPICYPRDHDAMLPLNRFHYLPVPVPPSGFALKAGDYLTPFLKIIYDHTH